MATKKNDQEKPEPAKKTSSDKAPKAAPLKKGKIKPVKPVVPSS